MGASIVPLQSTGGGGQPRRQPKPHFLLSLAEEQHIFSLTDPYFLQTTCNLKISDNDMQYCHFLKNGRL